jgi:two-component system OmpR family sensor kinase
MAPDALAALPMAVAVLRDTTLVYANERMREFVDGRPVSVAFEPVSGRPGLLRRGEDVFRVQRVPMAGGQTLIVVDPAEGADARLLSLASHDLRGSIGNARSFASLLQIRGTSFDERTQRGLDVIIRNADAAIGLVRDVFDLLRARVGAVPVEVGRVDASEALGKVASAASIDARIAPGLWVWGDAERLEHAARAFIEHGVWRAPEGSRRVTLKAMATGPSAWVGVTDPGPAPGAGELADAYSPVRAARGHKLGPEFQLCVAAVEIEAMAGTTGASEGLDGTTHFFTLPLAVD